MKSLGSTFYWSFIFLFLFSACGSWDKVERRGANTAVDGTYEDSDLAQVINPYREVVDAQMGSVIGYSDSTLVKYSPESPLGNFVADIVFKKGMALNGIPFPNLNTSNTFALLNFGGLRAPINEGEITIGSVYELMPFDNTISIVELRSNGIQELVAYIKEYNGQPISNAEFHYENDGRSTFSINGQPVDFDQPVYVITSDYLTGGGDKMNFLKNAESKWDAGFLIREAIIESVKETEHITMPAVSGRITIEQ